MRISDWSSDVCSSDVIAQSVPLRVATGLIPSSKRPRVSRRRVWKSVQFEVEVSSRYLPWVGIHASQSYFALALSPRRSEAHTSELQSLMRISYAVFCLKKTIPSHTTNINLTA